MEKIEKEEVLNLLYELDLSKKEYKCAIDFINALPTATDEWISVSERLPGHGEDYNVVLDLQDNMGPPVSGIMEFDGISKKWNYPGSNVECDCVTHWMPLPQPPTK